MILPDDIRRRLARIGDLADDKVDLAEAALVLAAIDRPRAAFEPYRRHLAKLAADVAAYAGPARASPDLEDRAEALTRIIARRYGYGCGEDAYDDLDGANLMRVIDSRRGLPVILGIIYIQAARRLGWPIAGIDFPGRFLVRLEDAGRRLILDPSEGGRGLSPADLRLLLKAVAGNDAELTPSYFQPVSNRAILLRVQNNIKVRLLQAGRMEEALRVVETMALFSPQVAALWREAGLLNARLDNLKAAVAALEEYLRQDSGDPGRYRTSALLQELRSRLN